MLGNSSTDSINNEWIHRMEYVTPFIDLEIYNKRINKIMLTKTNFIFLIFLQIQIAKKL